MGSGLAVFFFDSLNVLFDFRTLAFDQRHDLTERPLEIRVAHLLTRRAVTLAGRSVAASNQSRVGKEVTDLRESLDVVDLIQHRHRDDPADAWDRFEQIVMVRLVDFGRLFEEPFEVADLHVVRVQHRDVGVNRKRDRRVGEAIGDSFAVAFVLQLLGEGGQVLLVVDDLDVSQRFAPAADEVGATTKQVACRTPVFGVGVSESEVAATQQSGEFLRVDLVAFDFAAVDRFEKQGVSEDEGDLSFFASVTQPVPVEG